MRASTLYQLMCGCVFLHPAERCHFACTGSWWKTSGEMGCVTPMLFVLCVCGTLLSSYAVYIEQSKQADNSYKAHCDLDETIACTHVLTSE